MKRLDVFNTMDKLLDRYDINNSKSRMEMYLAKKYIEDNGSRKYFLAISENGCVDCVSENDYKTNPILRNQYNYDYVCGLCAIEIDVQTKINNRYFGMFRKDS